MRPATVRIYPTVVLAGTELERQYRSGDYVPQTVEQAVDLCSRLVPLFTKAGVRIIRLGLHSSPEVKEKMVAGAFHDSFGELVYSRMLLRRVLAYPPGAYTVTVHPRYYSRFVGNKKQNLDELAARQYQIRLQTDTALAGEMRIEYGIKNT